jgi:hypothetical protein
MGRDIHVAIVIRNTETGYYDKIEIFNKKKDKYVSINPYDIRNHELFKLLEDDIPWNQLHTTFLAPSFAKEIQEIKNTIGYFNFKEVNFADLRNYLMCNPTTLDDNMVEKTNPLKFFIERIEYYIEFAGYEYYYPSDIYILYWFDN